MFIMTDIVERSKQIYKLMIEYQDACWRTLDKEAEGAGSEEKALAFTRLFVELATDGYVLINPPPTSKYYNTIVVIKLYNEMLMRSNREYTSQVRHHISFYGQQRSNDPNDLEIFKGRFHLRVGDNYVKEFDFPINFPQS